MHCVLCKKFYFPQESKVHFELLGVCAAAWIAPPVGLIVTLMLGIPETIAIIRNETCVQKYISGYGTDELPQLTCRKCMIVPSRRREIKEYLDRINAQLTREREAAKQKIREGERQRAHAIAQRREAHMGHRADRQLARILSAHRYDPANCPIPQLHPPCMDLHSVIQQTHFGSRNRDCNQRFPMPLPGEFER